MRDAPPLRSGWALFATASLLLLLPQPTTSISVVVHNGYEFHAALTSPNVTWILLGNNVSGWPAAGRSAVLTTACMDDCDHSSLL